MGVGDNGRYVGRIELLAGNGSVKLDRYEAIPMDDKIKSRSDIQTAIVAARRKIDEAILSPLGMSYNMPVGIASYTIIYDEFGDAAGSNLGGLVADAIYYYSNSDFGTDIAIVAAGVLRDPDTNRKIQSVADIFRAMSLGSGNDYVPGYALFTVMVHRERA